MLDYYLDSPEGILLSYRTPSEILEEDEENVLDMVLPDTMTYPHVLDEFTGETEPRSFKEALLSALTTRFQHRQLNESKEYWVQKYSKTFTPVWVDTVGKRYAIWMQDRELDVNYANITETHTLEHIEPVRDASFADTPSTKDISTREFKQPSGPLGASDIISKSMDSIHHPFTRELEMMEKWFINEKLAEWLSCY